MSEPGNDKIFRFFKKTIEEEKKKAEDNIEKNKEIKRVNNFIIIEGEKGLIGKGGYGEVRRVEFNGKKYAAKLIKLKKGDINESESVQKFRGQGLVKINKTFNERYDGNNYSLIIMEESPLKSIEEFKINLKDIGENLLRYFIKQLIHGLEILYRNSLQHFDIKPRNILIFPKLIVKWTDFGLLRSLDQIKIDKTNKVKIPGGTPGYFSPEYYQFLSEIDEKDAIKQDFFAFGATIYYLKYGERMLEYNEFKTDNENSGQNYPKNAELIIDLIERAMDKIKSDKKCDSEFIKFLTRLIHYKPSERPNFEEIYRNKWVNKNSEEIKNINEINRVFVEQKMVNELNKSDFLIKKRDYIYKKREEENIYYNRKNMYNKHKFIIKPKKKK